MLTLENSFPDMSLFMFIDPLILGHGNGVDDDYGLLGGGGTGCGRYPRRAALYVRGGGSGDGQGQGDQQGGGTAK